MTRPSSLRKRAAILDAAEHVFARDGFDVAAVDEIADRSGVSKQTVYSHFGAKRELFVAVVTGATTAASDTVHLDVDEPRRPSDVPGFLEHYGRHQLDVVLQPRMLAMRRLATAEVHRFPQLGEAFWAGGPGRAMTAMRDRFARLHDAGLLAVPDADAAARTFNWLLMADAVNRVMLLGDTAIPGPDERRAVAAEAARVFLAAYGRG